MIRAENYFTEIGRFAMNSFPDALKKGHDLVVQVTSNGNTWEKYYSSATLKRVIDKYIEKLNSYVETIPDVAPKARKESVKREVRKSLKKKKEIKTSKPKEKKIRAKVTIKTKMVRSLKEEVKFIKRFVGLHNKRKSANAILAFIKAIQRSITLKLITVKSPFVNEVEYIQDKLITIYNEITKRRKSEELIVFDDKVLTKMVSIAGGESVFPSVGFMKAFIGMQGKMIDSSKRDNFIARLHRAVKNKKVQRDDPFAKRLERIYQYLVSYKSGKKIEISKAELNGLEGIVKACGCSKSLGKIYDTKGKALRRCKKKTYSDAKKGACSHNKGLSGLPSGVMTAEQIANLQFELLPFFGSWADLFGKPEKNFTLMLHGEPGAGKSTFLIKFAKFLTNFGKVLYLSSEEYGSVTLQNLIKAYLNPIPNNLEFAQNLDSVKISDYDFVIYDSINHLGLKLDKFKEVKAENPNTAFIMVLQHAKDGHYRGGKEWEHEAQIAAEVKEGTINVYKNRYGGKNRWYFFDN